MMKIVCVTACPTGIAHTYMAAEMLEHTAQLMKIELKVETNGAMGVENKLNSKDIEDAIAVIIAADIHVDMERFRGKPLIEVPVSKAIHDANELIQNAIDGKFPVY